jgi:hypothetical protein
MHPNPAFRTEAAAQNLAFARARGFGTLCLNGPEAPMLSHVPFVLNDDGTEAELHLVRSNPIARAVTEATPATLAVIGPDAYVSPDWYDTPDQVPTWNYVAVHLRGHLSLADPDTLRAHLDTVSAAFEGRLPKTPWTTDKMSEGGHGPHDAPDPAVPLHRRGGPRHVEAEPEQDPGRPPRRRRCHRGLSGRAGDRRPLSDLMRNGGPPEMDKPRTLT